MIVKVDAQDFVISVEPEAVDSAIREIQRSEAMPEATQVCKGPWHYKGGKGVALPLSAFDMSRNHPGKRNKTCTECLLKSEKRSVQPLQRGRPVQSAALLPTENQNFAAPLNDGGLQHKWEVTIVKTDVVILYAKDYASAGKQAGDGDVINVRRMD